MELEIRLGLVPFLSFLANMLANECPVMEGFKPQSKAGENLRDLCLGQNAQGV